MRILQLHAGYRLPAGEDTVVAAEAAALDVGGHDVRRLVEQNPTGTTAAVTALARSLGNRRVAERVRSEVRRFRPDVVHVHNTWFALSSSAVDAAADLDVPIVMTVHNYRLGCIGADLFRGDGVCTACVGRAPLPGVLHGCYRGSRVLSAVAATEVAVTRHRRTLDRVTRFVAPSAFMADRLVDIGIPSDRLVVKPHFVDDPGPRPRPPSASDEVLFIGRLAPGKGLPALLRAWERYRHRTVGADEPASRLRLTIVGDGPLAGELLEAAPRGIDVAGWLPPDEVRRRMAAARAFVFPSEWYEPFGMVLIEAMSAGLPIVVSNAADAARITGAPPEMVVAAGDDRELAAALIRLDDDALVESLGTGSRRRFEEHYDLAAGIAGLEELYAEARRHHGSGAAARAATPNAPASATATAT